MSNGNAPNTAAQPRPAWLVAAITLLPAITSLLMITVLIISARLTFVSFSDPQTWNSIAMVVLFSLTGLAVGYGIRYLLPSEGPPPVEDGNPDRNRAKIARWVVVAGTIGIFVTAMTVIIAFAIKGQNWEERAYSVFTTILPVFSTWVGTVLAFYFSNESFRQAAAASQSLVSGSGPSGGGDPITKPGIMIPYETITKYAMTVAEIGRKEPRSAAADLNLKQIAALFAQGARRLVIFDDKKIPLYVLRRTALPDTVGETDTLKTYLDVRANEEAARNFTWTSTTASVADARRTLELRRVTDLFITEHGGSEEPTIGWVPDENLGRS